MPGMHMMVHACHRYIAVGKERFVNNVYKRMGTVLCTLIESEQKCSGIGSLGGKAACLLVT